MTGNITIAAWQITFIGFWAGIGIWAGWSLASWVLSPITSIFTRDKD